MGLLRAARSLHPLGGMKTKPRVVFHGFRATDALAARIDEEIADLERICDRITSCRVAVELPHRHQRRGRHFQVKIELVVPGATLAVGRDPAQHTNFEDPQAALNEVFGTLRRQLREYVRVRRGRVKSHLNRSGARAMPRPMTLSEEGGSNERWEVS